MKAYFWKGINDLNFFFLVEDVPSKKPCHIEDQIVTDENGKRRFHGAFTGGFSAGFWNTVGSLEGWTPQSFKSSRSEKAAQMKQKPTDFMDSEDLGEFGIAPQRIQTTEDFAIDADEAKSNKRKFNSTRRTATETLIFPVLEKLIEPVKDKVAIRILKSMGWKPGQGVGARKTRKEKKFVLEQNSRAQYVLEKYGCDLNVDIKPTPAICDQSDSESSDEEVTFAPYDYEVPDFMIKVNTFGLGYEGLSHDTISKQETPKGHINLFENLEATNKKKHLSITGQAFGVGAYEEEDEDIYAKDDLTRYDFSLNDKGTKKKPKPKLAITNKNIIEGFLEAKENINYQKTIYKVTLPENYKPRNWAVRKSRFEPLEGERLANLSLRTSYTSSKADGNHRFTPEERGSLLNEKETVKSVQVSITQDKLSKEDLFTQENKKSEALTKRNVLNEVKQQQTTIEPPGREKFFF